MINSSKRKAFPSDKQGSANDLAKAPAVSGCEPGGARKSDERSDSLLLSPLALMALGLAGAATAAISSEQALATSAVNAGPEPVNADIPTPTDATLAESTVDATTDVKQQLDALIQNMLVEKSSVVALATSLDTAEVQPIQLAMAGPVAGADVVVQTSAGAGDVVNAVVPAAADGAAAIGTAEVAATGISMGTVAAGIAGLALIGAASSSKSTPDTTAPAAPTVALASNSGSSADSITNVGTVNVTGLETGATWKYSTDAGTTWTTGSGSSFTLTGDGVKSATVRQTDAAGNTSVTSSALAFTLDSTAAAPTAALATNSGSTADSITNVGTVNVTGLEAGSTWQYSTDAGTTWVAGSGSSITLAGDGAKSVTVRQTDVAGNISAASSALAFTIDSTAAAPTLALATNSGSTADSITNVGTVNVTGLEAGSTWQYSTDAGATWVAGSGSSVTLTGDGTKSVTVRQTDAAGNSSVASSALAFTLDSTAAAPTLALATNSGSTADSITNVGTVNVTGLEAGATWQYSTDAGTTWVAGNGSSVTLTGDGAKSVTVRQTDAAGNTSAASSALAFTLDSSAAAPTVALTSDAGSSVSDKVTSNGALTASGEVGATFEYSSTGASGWSATAPTASEGANTVYVRQTDAAGNTSAASGPLTFTLDSVAPVIQSMAAHSATTTIALTYDGNLDAANLPAVGAFTVTTGGVANSVTSMAVSGNVLTLTLANAFSSSAVSLTYTDPTAGNDAAAVQDASGNDAPGFIQGMVADGYVRGAQIYVDANANGVADAGEILAGVVTDASGNFFMPSTAPHGSIIAVGGVNIDTGVLNTVSLKAPEGSTSINPLTTLVQAVIDATPGTNVADASSSVATALGLTLPSGQDLTTYDPLSATDSWALVAQKAAAQVATTLALAASAPVGDATLAVASVIDNFVTLINNAVTGATTLNLADTTTIDSLFSDGAGGSVASTTAVSDAKSALSIISTATTLDAMATAQSAVLDHIAPATPGIDLTAGSDSGESSSDNLTNDSTPTLRVTIEVAKADGTAVVVGDKVDINDGTGSVGSALVQDADLAQGYIDVTVNPLAAGAHSLTSAITDKGGNISLASSTLDITIDTSAAAPTLAFTDSGASDGTTNVGTVNVTGLETGASWQYSLNDGTDWTTGVGSTVTLTGDGAKSLIVRQTDVAGNTSANSAALSMTLDTGLPTAPTLALATDFGASDGITNVGTVNVTGLETGASWQYSLNSGTDWTTGVGTSLALSGDGTKSVVVRQVDLAGNTGATSAALSMTLDTGLPTAPTLALSTDSGVSDGITNVGTVDVIGLETGATWRYSLNGGADWSNGSASSVTLTGDGAKSIVVQQTDVAGNTSVASGALTFTFDGTGPTVSSVAVSSATGLQSSTLNAGDVLSVAVTMNEATTVSTSGGVPTLALDLGGTTVQASYASGSGTTGLVFNYRVLATQTDTNGVSIAANSLALNGGSLTDVAGNAATLTHSLVADNAGYLVDTTAPMVVMEPGTPNPTTGAVPFGFTFNEAVTGFAASDVTVGNGAKGAFTATDASHYSLDITPTASVTPLSLTVDVAAGAVTDAAGNASAAATQFLASVLFGTTGADTFTVGSALDHIFLGGGNDVIKLAHAADSTTIATDNVLDVFGAGDRIDLSALLGSGGSGYAHSVLADTGAGFMELKNLAISKDVTANQTNVTFDISLDASTIGGSKITGAVIDLDYQYSSVADGWITSPTFSGKAVWKAYEYNLSAVDSTSPNGKIAVLADTSASNPIVDATGKILSVNLVLNGLVDTFAVSLASKAAGGLTEVDTADSVAHFVDVGVAKTAGAATGVTGTLEVITDTTTLGTVGDNQLHMVSTYDQSHNTTHLQVQYDTNATFGSGATTVSSIIALDFDGDMTANLTPASLTYI